jgi:hypothetical protein
MRLEFYGASKTTFQERRDSDGSIIVIKTTEMLLSHITVRGSGMSSIPTLRVSVSLSLFLSLQPLSPNISWNVIKLCIYEQNWRQREREGKSVIHVPLCA